MDTQDRNKPFDQDAGCYPPLEEPMGKTKTNDGTLLKSTALLAQMIRREIATLEWVTVCANHDLQKYGEWQCNWAEYQGEIQQTLDRLFARARLREKAEKMRERGRDNLTDEEQSNTIRNLNP